MNIAEAKKLVKEGFYEKNGQKITWDNLKGDEVKDAVMGYVHQFNSREQSLVSSIGLQPKPIVTDEEREIVGHRGLTIHENTTVSDVYDHLVPEDQCDMLFLREAGPYNGIRYHLAQLGHSIGARILDVQVVSRQKTVLRGVEAALAIAKPRTVLMTCFGVPYDDIAGLARLHPDVMFMCADFSNWQFLMLQQRIKATWDYGRLHQKSPNIFPAFCLREQAEIGATVIGVPSVYVPHPYMLPITDHGRNAPEGIINVGIPCSHRITKNVGTMLIAALLLNREQPICLHIVHNPRQVSETGYVEQFLYAAQQSGVPVKVHPWLSMRGFHSHLIPQCDIVFQATYTETFNYILLDAYSNAVPGFGTNALPWLPKDCQVDENRIDCPRSMAKKASEIISNYPASSRRAIDVAHEVADSCNKEATGFFEAITSDWRTSPYIMHP